MPAKILIVEDDKNLNLMLKLILKNKSLDWDLQSAHSGQEALDSLEKFLPDLIILDIMMPEMDGLEFLSRLRVNKKYASIKLAALSALNDAQTISRAQANGVDEYWTKPIMPDTLVSNIKRVLGL